MASRASARRPAFSSAIARATGELGRDCAVELLEQRGRLLEVIGTDLDELLSGPFVQPVGELDVELGPRSLDEPGVGDVANEHVLEAVRMLAGDRGAALTGDEVAQQQVVEHRLDFLELGHQVSDGAFPEDAADHRRALEQALLVLRQPVDAGGDHRLERVGDPLGGRPALEQHPRRLLDEERVPLGLLEQRAALGRRQLAIGEQRVEQFLALLGRQRLELDRRRAQAAAAPAGADVEQLGPREADDQQGCVLDPLGEVLDQLEQRLLGPVNVLEDEDQRLCIGQLRRPLAGGPGDLFLAPLGLDPLEHADGEREQVGDGVVAAAGAQLRDGLLDGIVVRDPGSHFDHLRDRPVRDAFTVRERAATEDRGALDAGDELPRQPALADPRLRVDREQMGALVADHARERVVQQLELELAGDEARGDARHAVAGLPKPREPPGDQRLAEALQRELAALLGLGDADRQPACEGPDQDLTRCSRLLQPRRDVDRLAGREGRVGLVGDDLAGLDADSRLESEAVHGVEDRRRGAHRALGVVLVRLRDPEGGHDGISGELLDDAAVRGDAVRDLLEEGVDAAPHDLGIARGDELGRADEIDEEDGCELAFHPVIVVTRSLVTGVALASAACSIPRRSRRTTSAASTRTSSTRRARTRSAAPTSSTSSRGGSRSAATCASRRLRCPPR